MDFVFDALSTGQRIECLALVFDSTEKAGDILVGDGISGVRVTRTLDEMAYFRGYLGAIRTNQGPKFTGKALYKWPANVITLYWVWATRLYRVRATTVLIARRHRRIAFADGFTSAQIVWQSGIGNL